MASEKGSAILSGYNNKATGYQAFIGGGENNEAGGWNAMIVGGWFNKAMADYSTVCGGSLNKALARFAWIGGGEGNQAITTYATVGGGKENTAGAVAAFVGGGGKNIAEGNYSAIGGGIENRAAGGSSVVAGGKQNSANSEGTVAGGVQNQAHGGQSTIGGGIQNQALGTRSTVGGGWGNKALTQGSAIGGGAGNKVQEESYGTISGGLENTAEGRYATVIGGYKNKATGWYSVAAGQQAEAKHSGSFVWADSLNALFTSRAANSFNVRASGGAYFSNRLECGPASGEVFVARSNGKTGDGRVGSAITAIGTNGSMGIYATSDTGTAGYFNGKVRAKVIQIDGGSDVAEPFSQSDGSQAEPGTVMVIDENNPGKLKPSTQAYDTRVAGIVSGAGGVNPGLILTQEGTVVDGDVPVALSGRVYVKASAEGGPIRPGDLLTTSDLPGHAMRASDRERRDGAVIGKAMTELKEGTGLVLVLVNLQ